MILLFWYDVRCSFRFASWWTRCSAEKIRYYLFSWLFYCWSWKCNRDGMGLAFNPATRTFRIKSAAGMTGQSFSKHTFAWIHQEQQWTICTVFAAQWNCIQTSCWWIFQLFSSWSSLQSLATTATSSLFIVTTIAQSSENFPISRESHNNRGASKSV